jgi:hypothetical protein
VRICFCAGIAALISSPAFAQSDGPLATPTGHKINATAGSYTYSEPGAQSISIHGVKFGADLVVRRRAAETGDRDWYLEFRASGHAIEGPRTPAVQSPS